MLGFLVLLSISSITANLLFTDQSLIFQWTMSDFVIGIVSASGWSILISILSVMLASVVGLALGLASGFYGNDKIKTSILSIFWIITTIFFCWFYGWYTTSTSPTVFRSILSIIITFSISYTLWKLLTHFHPFSKNVKIPMDALIGRIIELFNSVPRIVVIIVLATLIDSQSLFALIISIGLTSWTDIARVVRNEVLKEKENSHIEASTALGISSFKIIHKHIIPNILYSVIFIITFNISSIILLESGLSFLGIGVPENVITLGKIIEEGRHDFSDVKLILVPGIIILLLVYIFNKMGDHLQKHFNKKI